MRVTVSSRANHIRKHGNPVAGSIVRLLDGGRRCSVEWDDSAGAYNYNTAVDTGLELAEVIAPEEPHQPPTRGRRVVRFLKLYADNAPCSDAGEQLLNDLQEEGYMLEGSSTQSSCSGLATLLCRCDVYVVFLNSLLLRSLQQGGYVKKELEYAIQELPRGSIITVSLDERARLTPHMGALATELMRAPNIDLSRGDSRAQDDAFTRFLQLIKEARTREERNAPSRPATTASRLPGTLRK